MLGPMLGPMLGGMRVLWYVAYGSNMDPAMLARYVDPRPPRPGCWVRVPREVWFGGRSRRWRGGVAFLSLHTVAAPRARWCRAHRLDVPALRGLFRGENGYPDADLGPLDLPPGRWRTVPIPLSDDGTRGKYDTLLRLADIDGLPAYTLTTSRDLPAADPAPEYAALIDACLAAGPSASPRRTRRAHVYRHPARGRS